MQNTFARCLGMALAVAALAAPLAAQEDDLRNELDALKAGQAEIQRQLELEKKIEALAAGQEEIKKQLAELARLVQARPAAPSAAAAAAAGVKDVVFDLGANPIKGTATAQVTLVEFTDYQCPYCARHVRDTYPQLAEEYIDTGKIRYAMLDLPLESIHKQAFKAAEASHCAEEQGMFWEMHHRLFENQKSLEPWSAHAEALGLDTAKFEDCLSSGRHAEAIRKDMAQAQRAGARGTPSFVVARTDPQDPTKVTGITFLRGAQGFNSFKAALDAALGDGGS